MGWVTYIIVANLRKSERDSLHVQAANVKLQTFNNINAIMRLLLISIMTALISAGLSADGGLVGKKWLNEAFRKINPLFNYSSRKWNSKNNKKTNVLSILSKAGNSFLLWKIIPFPKFICNFFRIPVADKQTREDELRFLTQLESRKQY
jgi:hypothetical protein